MLETATLNIEPTVAIKDDRFDVNIISKCTLKIDLSKNRFQFCIVNNEINTCVWLEDYQFTFYLDEDSILTNLNQIYQNHQFLPANYWQSIQIQVNSKVFTLIPKSIYKSDDAIKYLQLLTGSQVNDKYFIFDEIIKDKEIVCVFGIEKEIINWFKNMYPAQKVKPIPRIITFIENSFLNYSQNCIHLSFEDDKVDVIYQKNGNLILCNYYTYRTIHDLEYYLLMICNEMDCLNPGVEVYLYNEITPFSEAFQIIERNFTEKRFANLISKIKYSQYFIDLPEHRYVNLFGMNAR